MGGDSDAAETPKQPDEYDETINVATAIEITVAEIHATVLGLVGFPVGLGVYTGFPEYSIGFTISLLAIAFGLRAIPDINGQPTALETVAHEPWYFTFGYVIAFTAGLSVGIVIAYLELTIPP